MYENVCVYREIVDSVRNFCKASGPDTINIRILKELCRELLAPLYDLFNQSLRISEYPEAWKEANVTPIFKSGDRSLHGNYRPVMQNMEGL